MNLPRRTAPEQKSVRFIIIIMEICKAPTLRLKALNKHTHVMYTETGNVIKKIFKKSTRVFKHYARDARARARAHTHTHTHTHTVQTDRSEGLMIHIHRFDPAPDIST